METPATRDPPASIKWYLFNNLEWWGKVEIMVIPFFMQCHFSAVKIIFVQIKLWTLIYHHEGYLYWRLYIFPRTVTHICKQKRGTDDSNEKIQLIGEVHCPNERDTLSSDLIFYMFSSQCLMKPNKICRCKGHKAEAQLEGANCHNGCRFIMFPLNKKESTTQWPSYVLIEGEQK